MKAILGIDLLAATLVYGYCLAAQPRYATAGAKRVAGWTFTQPLAVRCAIACAAWLVFMTGIYLVARGTG